MPNTIQKALDLSQAESAGRVVLPFLTIGGHSPDFLTDGADPSQAIIDAVTYLDSIGGGGLLIKAAPYSCLTSIALDGFDNIFIEIESGAVITIDDDAVLDNVHTKVGSTSSSTYNPLFNIQNCSNFHISCKGKINTRGDIYTKPIGVMVRDSANFTFDAHNTEVTVGGGSGYIGDFIFGVDVANFNVRQIINKGNMGAVVSCEGIEVGHITDIDSTGSFEAVDSNAYNDSLLIQRIYGTNLGSQVVDMNAVANCTTRDIYAYGTTPQLVFLRNYAVGIYTGAFTAKTEADFLHCDHNTLDNIHGIVSGKPIDVDCQGGTMQYLTVTNVDVTSTGGNTTYSQFRSSVVNSLDFMVLEGVFRNTAAASDALHIGEKIFEKARINITVEASGAGDSKGIVITGMQNGGGDVTAINCGGAGVYLRSNTSSRQNENLRLNVSAHGCNYGLEIDASTTTMKKITAFVNCYGNTTKDIFIGHGVGGTLEDIEIFGGFETETVTYDPTVFVNNRQFKTVAPTSTPKRVGLTYIDTVLSKVYVSTGIASSADWSILN